MSNIHNKVRKVLKAACLEAGKIISANYGKDKNVRSKGANDWVTTQDIKVEKVIIANLTRGGNIKNPVVFTFMTLP